MTSSFYPYKLDSRITLKKLEASNAKEFLKFVQSNRSHLQAYDPFVRNFNTAKDIALVLSKIEHLHTEGKSLSCGLWEDASLIGFFNCGLDLDAKTVRLGFGLAKNHQGHGIITRTAHLILDYAFNELGMDGAWLTCWVNNTACIRVAERLGFTRDSQTLAAEPQHGILQYQYRYMLKRTT